MKKRFIKGSIIESVIDPENGTTKIDMLWKINFSRLPYMSHLLGFISFSLNNKDINYINPSLFIIINIIMYFLLRQQLFVV